ncbi:MAG: hypothetical protein ACTSR8_13345 [Promethearchaeota archaeon]
MKYEPYIKQMVCQSCGLSLTRSDLDNYWRKIRDQNIEDDDSLQKKRNRRKEWLDWYSSSKKE